MTENMERRLSIWVKDQNQRRVPLSLQVIQVKARSMSDDVKEKVRKQTRLQQLEGGLTGTRSVTTSVVSR